MSTQLNVDSFIAVLKKSGLLDAERMQRFLRETSSAGAGLVTAAQVADRLVAENLVTRWQADKLIQGKHRGYFLGKYKLLSLLGKGGMSSVYMAEHLLMRRRCAIKVLPARRVDDSSYLERFYREAQAVAAVDHPNIVRAYDVDHQDDGDRQIHFIVMEYVDGTSIQDLVPAKGLASFLDAAEYARQAALGLQHAHENGMVHRDIKPGNLLVDRNGTVRILDLGLARFFRVDEGVEALTIRHDEKVLGTADYLAPEQALDSHGVDARADLYSLGCTLYFMVTGQPPFTEGTLAQRLLAHQLKTPPSVEALRPDLPASLVAIIRKLMEKSPTDRFASAAETEATLFRWVDENADDDWRRLHSAVYGSRVHDSKVAVRIPKANEKSRSAAPATKPLSDRETPFPLVSGPNDSASVESCTAESLVGETHASALADFLSTLDQTDGSAATSEPASALSKAQSLPTVAWKNTSTSIQSPQVNSSQSKPNSGFSDFDSETPAAQTEPPARPRPSIKSKKTLRGASVQPSKWKFNPLLVLGTIFGLIACVFIIPSFLSDHSDRSKNGRSPQQITPFPTDKRQVTVGGKDGEFRSIREALVAVRDRFRPTVGSADRIVIRVNPGTYNERIHMDGQSSNWPEGIRLVGIGNVRLAPLGDDPVLRLANLSRFSIENVQIDADEKKVAIQLRDDLHECRLSDVAVEDFSEIGIDCVGAQGLSFGNSQLLLERVRFAPASSNAIGIRLSNGPENEANNIIIRGCRFLQAVDAGIVFQGSSPYGITICESIFSESNDGIRFEGKPVLKSVQIFNNSFREMSIGIHFRNLPDDRSSELRLRRNLFLKIRNSEAVVDQGFDENRFRSMLSTQPPGVQENWTDRSKTSSSIPGEVQLLFNDGRQGVENLAFESTDPELSGFLAPTEKSPQRDVPGAQGDEKKWVGAVGPK